MPRRRKRSAALVSRDGGSVSASVPTPTDREFTIARISRTAASYLGDRIENPDEVLKQFGSWEGLAFYARMLRQYPFLVGICRQWIFSIAAIDRAIKPGKPGDETSEQMASDARKLYGRIDGREIINEKLLWGRYFGFSPVEKVWEKDTHTGLLAPLKLYDLPPWNFRFGANGEIFVLTRNNQTTGERVTDPRKFMFFRWGSRYTDYGEGDLKFAYLPTWYIQQALRFGMEALERFGRPIPWVRYWRGMDKDEVAALKSALVSQFKFYVLTPDSAPETNLEFPAINVTAAGAAGRAEIEFVRYMVGWCYVALLGTQQTQDRSGGSRALEEVRNDISGDQTPPGSQALDTVWTKQWLDEISEVNWPNQPRELWPRFDSDVDSENFIDGSGLMAITDISAKLVAKQMTSKWAEEQLVRAGVQRTKASEMVASTIAEMDSLQPSMPAQPFGQPAPVGPDDDEEMPMDGEGEL